MPSAPSPSSSAQAARQALADRLRAIREEAELSAVELSARAGWHKSKTSRIEHGVQTASAADIRVWCAACAAEGQVPDLLAALRTAEGAYVEWRRLNRGGLATLQGSYVPLYERTALMRSYQSHVVPGMLQTAGYASALLARIATFRGIPDDSEAAGEARVRRQRLLRSGKHRFAFLLEEAVLRQGVGGGQVMAEQLGRLMEVATLPSVSVGVIPARADRPLWTLEGFTLYDDFQAHVELLSARVTLTAPGEIATYVKAFEELSAMAVYGDAARALILRALEGLP
ncbi:helix-turn-helix transcriptional regulator [Actinocorallia sp. A-T 12471]|uniref:helix-turn-helix domain-containing protein n=1 Tax=Actinocorallia sp. A-T 12471 TaxID=3089813 RepID=UPI0029D12328|nr:helix-turn-helix transcriptional regulator [Actinocorallia sp. A-T 12471]MDX6745095.1 helix-turn-helix transcriptional regulator [Actinocorallia sp. A-T 12471]